MISTLVFAIGCVLGKAGPRQGLQHRSSAARSRSRVKQPRKGRGHCRTFDGIIPNAFCDAFARGDPLQVLLIAILSGFAVIGVILERELELVGG